MSLMIFDDFLTSDNSDIKIVITRNRSVVCKRTKLMLVGLGEAGKTSLLNALITAQSDETTRKGTHKRPPITDGIDIKEWSVELRDNTSLVYSM